MNRLVILGLLGFGVYEYWDKIAGMLGIISSGHIELPIDNSQQPSVAQPIRTPVVNPTPSIVPVNQGNAVNPYNPTTAQQPDTNLYSLLRRYVVSNPSFLTNNTATFDGWNWAVRQVGGNVSVAIEDVFPGMDRGNPLTLDDYWTGLNNLGLTGAGVRNRGMGGLGQIFDTDQFLNYYQTNQMPINGKVWI